MQEEQKKEYWKPSVTADIVVVDSHLAKYRNDGTFINLLLIRRSEKSEAFPSCWALPGGFLDKGESIEDCAVRELKEETGLEAKMLAPIGVFSKPDRDPRSQVISHAFMTMMISSDEQPLPFKAGDDANEAALFRLIGTFSEKDGSLDVALRSPKNGKSILFTAKFTRGRLGTVETEIKYSSSEKLAFDHAEIIARTILRVPDLVLPTKTKPVAGGEDGNATSDGEAK